MSVVLPTLPLIDLVLLKSVDHSDKALQPTPQYTNGRKKIHGTHKGYRERSIVGPGRSWDSATKRAETPTDMD